MTYTYAPGLGEAAAAFPPAGLDDVSAARARVEALAAGRADSTDWTGVVVEDRRVEGDGGTPVKVAIFRPTDSVEPVPTMVFFHGGGFVLGDERSNDPLLTMLVRELQMAIVSVDYRLAPEHPCPAALEDGRTVLRWCAANAASERFDTGRLALGGQSAGAAIAAGVALANRSNDPPLSFLFLGEPVLDPRLATPSMTAMDDTPVWRRRDAELSWRYYLGDHTVDDLPPYASPATCELVDHLPPTYITANEVDPLRDEAIDFARRLLGQGVAVEFHLYRGAFHGSMSFEAPVSVRARADLIDELRRGLVDAGICGS
ncbi:alpha/beta hydrolase [Desertimonas flava]|uniref:alpha/beta hydrolase n=1 Tax=Desertimonas flava TaxID=2064846 RepID=UPI0013C46051|nr:alpha/beta hydrolase [Desertimonas flava]